MLRHWTGLIAVLAALAAAAPASAQAPPIPLGPGENASMVTDGVGLTHIVFENGGDYVYCRLPRNARGVRHPHDPRDAGRRRAAADPPARRRRDLRRGGH